MNQKTGYFLVALMLCSSAFAGIQKKIASETQSSCSRKDLPAKASHQEETLRPSPFTLPARIIVPTRSYLACNVSIDTSFIYWFASQDGMSLASSANLQSGTAVNLENGSTQLIQPFNYDPGFKVGLGIGYDDWELHTEYTWVRQNTSINSNAPPSNGAGGTSVWLMNNWFAQAVGSNNNSLSATQVSSKWHLGIDWLDATVGRPYYQSRSMVLSPYGGIRALWIRQSLNIGANVPSAALTIAQLPLSAQPIYSRNQSHSWSLGPVFGSGARWLIGSGVRLEGHGDISLLFTQYSRLTHSENSVSANSDSPLFGTSQTNFNTVRPTAQLGLGIGWGSYTYCGKYHVDFSADYDFNVFWNQNMIRSLVDNFSAGSSSSGDLFLHGLTLTGRFDF